MRVGIVKALLVDVRARRAAAAVDAWRGIVGWSSDQCIVCQCWFSLNMKDVVELV